MNQYFLKVQYDFGTDEAHGPHAQSHNIKMYKSSLLL